jgi:hypothetical protein
MCYLEKENEPHITHMDDEYLYELWVLECQM